MRVPIIRLLRPLVYIKLRSCFYESRLAQVRPHAPPWQGHGTRGFHGLSPDPEPCCGRNSSYGIFLVPIQYIPDIPEGYPYKYIQKHYLSAFALAALRWRKGAEPAPPPSLAPDKPTGGRYHFNCLRTSCTIIVRHILLLFLLVVPVSCQRTPAYVVTRCPAFSACQPPHMCNPLTDQLRSTDCISSQTETVLPTAATTAEIQERTPGLETASVKLRAGIVECPM